MGRTLQLAGSVRPAGLRAAPEGGLPSTEYNETDILTYVWNEALYSAISDASISGSLLTLSNAARVSYSRARGGNVQNITNSEALSLFANPWTLTSINIQPTTQGTSAVYNTLVIILIMVQESFSSA